MYGMIPIEKMHAVLRLPPLKSDTNPSTWPSAPVWACCIFSAIFTWSIIGSGT